MIQQLSVRNKSHRLLVIQQVGLPHHISKVPRFILSSDYLHGALSIWGSSTFLTFRIICYPDETKLLLKMKECYLFEAVALKNTRKTPHGFLQSHVGNAEKEKPGEKKKIKFVQSVWFCALTCYEASIRCPWWSDNCGQVTMFEARCNELTYCNGTYLFSKVL